MKSLKAFIQNHPLIMELIFLLARLFISAVIYIVPAKKKRMIFVSLSGRNFDDSPKAIYDIILGTQFFDDWELIWAFKEPEKFRIRRGKCIKFGSFTYWKTLITSAVWVGNGGLDCGLDLSPEKRVVVNTWHGSVLKKGLGEENTNAVLKTYRRTKPIDHQTIRCAQNEFDIQILSRLLKADEKCFLRCGLPRNDVLLSYKTKDKVIIKKQLGIDIDKKVILYMPTYREYLIDDNQDNYIVPPISVAKWREKLGADFVFLVRVHYAISSALSLATDDFVKDVSDYQPLSELYFVADFLITDYSSCFYDFAILGKPFICFAYDREEYESKRGLFFRLEDVMPCGIFKTEDEVIERIISSNYYKDCSVVEMFRKERVPYFGHGSIAVVNEIMNKLDN